MASKALTFSALIYAPCTSEALAASIPAGTCMTGCAVSLASLCTVPLPLCHWDAPPCAPSMWRAFTQRTSPLCWTLTASPSGLATTARSRCTREV